MKKTDISYNVSITVAHSDGIDAKEIARSVERALCHHLPSNTDDCYVTALSVTGGIQGAIVGAAELEGRNPAMSRAFEASYGPVKVETPGPYATAFDKIFSETGIKSEGRLMAYITSDADWSGIKGIYVTDKSGDKTVWCRDTPEQPSPSVSLPDGWKLYTDTPQRLVLSKRGECSVYIQPGNEKGSNRSVIYRFMEDLHKHLSDASSQEATDGFNRLVTALMTIAKMNPMVGLLDDPQQAAKEALKSVGIKLERS